MIHQDILKLMISPLLRTSAVACQVEQFGPNLMGRVDGNSVMWWLPDDNFYYLPRHSWLLYKFDFSSCHFLLSDSCHFWFFFWTVLFFYFCPFWEKYHVSPLNLKILFSPNSKSHQQTFITFFSTLRVSYPLSHFFQYPPHCYDFKEIGLVPIGWWATCQNLVLLRICWCQSYTWCKVTNCYWTGHWAIH